MGITSHPSAAAIAHLVFPDGEGTDRQRADAAVLVGVLQRNDPDTIPVLYRLLTTGTGYAHKWLKRSLSDNLSFRGYNKQDRPDWDKRYIRIQHALLDNSYLDWVFHNVVSESGREWNVEGDLKAFDYVRIMLAAIGRQPMDMDGSGDTYWRGAVAYAIVRMDTGYDVNSETDADIMKFVRFAGNSTDIRAVVEAAQSIKSVKLERLQNALEEGSAPIMREGVL